MAGAWLLIAGLFDEDHFCRPFMILDWERGKGNSSKGDSSTPPLALGFVGFRDRPGPTQLACLCRGSRYRTRETRPSWPRFTKSRFSASRGRAQYCRRCVRLFK